MIASPEHTDLDKKRTLKKVRTNFLSKRPEIEEHAVVPVPKLVNPYKMQMVSGGWGIVEQDRNIHMGLKYLNACLDVRNVKIQDSWNSAQVVLRPQISNQACLVPWEYSVRRLESYGDLDLATLAHKMREFNGRYDGLIGKYHRLMESDNVETIENIERARINARDCRKRIESGYPFTVMKLLYDKSGVNLHSMTYNETILREIEQSVEGFARWAESKGVPVLFPHAEKISLAEVKRIVSQDISIISEVEEGPEFEALICDGNGNQRRVVIQNVRICEPTESGFLISVYTILKNSQMQQSVFELEDEIKKEYDRRGIKWVKYENQLGVSMEEMYDKVME